MTAPPEPPRLPEPLMPLLVAAKPGAKPREVIVDEATAEQLQRDLTIALQAIRAAKLVVTAMLTPPLPSAGVVVEAMVYCGARLADGNYCELDDGHPGTHMYTDVSGDEVTWGDVVDATIHDEWCTGEHDDDGPCPSAVQSLARLMEMAAGMDGPPAVPPLIADALADAARADDISDMGEDVTDSIAEGHDADVAAAVVTEVRFTDDVAPGRAGSDWSKWPDGLEDDGLPVNLRYCGTEEPGPDPERCARLAGHPMPHRLTGGHEWGGEPSADAPAGTVLLAGLRAGRGTGA